MGDSEDKKIDYSAEELEEINRIINDNFTAETMPPVDLSQPEKKPVSSISSPDDADDDLPDISDDIGIPDDIDLPEADFDYDKSTSTASVQDDYPEDISGLIKITDGIQDDLDDITPLSTDDITVIDENPDDTVDDIEDLTDIDTFEQPTKTTSTFDSKPKDGTLQGKSPLDQLNALTMEEPDSLDVQDISTDAFIDDTQDLRRDSVPDQPGATDDFSDISGLDDDLPDLADDIETIDETVESSKSKPGTGISIDENDDFDIPDLSDIDNLGEANEIPEASVSDIPDIDIEDIGMDTKPGISETPRKKSETTGIAADNSIDDSDSLDDIPDISDLDLDGISDDQHEVVINVPTSDLHVADDSMDDSSLGDIEPLDDDDDVAVSPTKDDQKEDLELSDKELKKLKKAIILFNPGLIKAIKDAIVNDRLNPSDNRQLLDLILSGKPENNVHRFLEKKLNKKINLADERTSTRRKVITSRPEYTSEGRERQKRLLKITKIFGVSALSTIVLITMLNLLVLKPRKAKHIINEGVKIILQVGDEHKNFQKAEKLFQHVEDYQKDIFAFSKEKVYTYGCNEYGRAYFQKAEYDRSVSKFNMAYNFKFNNKKKVDIETLINLGNFYAKVPKQDYRRGFKDMVNKWYYHDPKTYDTERTQLDVSIYLYKRALLQEPSNISALYGIGNAYNYQGQYIKAEKFYKDILKVNKNAIVGYAGLLNLYIDRNAFAHVSKIHTELKYKEKLDKLPSALLAKLADYYLSKKRTDKQNLRIDYGVRSSNVIDQDDNPYPAIQSVLRALNQRDPYYPPLQVQSALLARAQKNFQVMKIHLEKALEYSKKYHNSDNYFAALHLLGEYYYHVKHPVKAYSYLKKATESFGNQPAFTREDFYKETEKIGHSYALMGNVFYYYFEKAKLRFGDLDDDTITKDMDRLASYNIARIKYEKAVAADYSSSELHYNLGRIYYLNKEYRQALDSWIKLYDDFVDYPDIMFSLGNAYYHIQRYEAAKGEYLKLISMYEHDADEISLPRDSNPRHMRIFSALASVYNNLGAVYQLQDNESKSHICYWKAIEMAKKIEKENEYARVNLARGFRKRENPEAPIIDENIPFSIDMYTEPKD